MKPLPIAASALILSLLVGCESTPAPDSQAKANTLHDECTAALHQMTQKEPEVPRFLNTCYAYVIFPDVSSGAVGVGGAYGRGEVYRMDKMIGYADLSQATVGAQLGGQSYSEIVFFQNAASFDEFRSGQTAFDARASAVAASHGGAEAADYQRGVAVFTMTQSGLMAQAAIGGQSFRYQANSDLPPQGQASERQ